MFHVGAESSSEHRSDDAASLRSSKHSTINPTRSSRYLRPFRSRRIKLEEAYDWRTKGKTRAERFARILPWLAFGVGLSMIVAGAYWGYSIVPKHKFNKVIWYQDFADNKLDLVNDFTRQIALDGWGANSMDWTTDNDNNSYVKDNKLYIQPTLTDPSLNVDGAFVNLTADGTCSKNYSRTTCYAERNATSGQFINAVQSARLSTVGKHFLKYGRIEVNAKLPLGDWLWSAIWMLPESTLKYGVWPASGEVDLLESRGNAPGYPGGGYNVIQSSVHMAPVGYNPQTATQPKGHSSHPTIPVPFSMMPKEFHTFGVDWTPQSIRVWLDDPIYPIVDWKFKKEPFTNFGLPAYGGHGEALNSPWLVSSHKSAPFDEPFHLILNVAVGGIPGYFNERGAPWSVFADFWNAQRQMWEAREEMESTWKTPFQPMIVDWIRMTELENADYWENLPSANYY